jgi:hypothetical protein
MDSLLKFNLNHPFDVAQGPEAFEGQGHQVHQEKPKIYFQKQSLYNERVWPFTFLGVLGELGGEKIFLPLVQSLPGKNSQYQEPFPLYPDPFQMGNRETFSGCSTKPALPPKHR